MATPDQLYKLSLTTEQKLSSVETTAAVKKAQLDPQGAANGLAAALQEITNYRTYSRDQPIMGEIQGAVDDYNAALIEGMGRNLQELRDDTAINLVQGSTHLAQGVNQAKGYFDDAAAFRVVLLLMRS